MEEEVSQDFFAQIFQSLSSIQPPLSPTFSLIFLSFSLESSMRLFDTHREKNGRRSFLKLSSLKFFSLFDSYISDSHIISELFIHFRLCLFCFVYTVIFFFK